MIDPHRLRLALVALTLAACGSSSSSDASDDGGVTDGPPPPSNDGGTNDAPSPATAIVTTSVLGAKTSAAWAAIDDGSGTFAPITAESAGMYRFAPKGTWSIVFACANADRTRSIVASYRRTQATMTLEVALDALCGAAGPAGALTLTGKLTNVPPTTGWLEFGYALDARGVILPVNGTTAQYELVNLANGTWDLAFGLRDESFSPLSRVVIRRAETITSDKTLDIDVGAAFTPALKPLVVHGVTGCDTLDAVLRYTMDGRLGLDVGPPDVPTTGTDRSMKYASIAAAAQKPADRYRGTIGCTVSKGDDTRTIDLAFHDTIDLDLTLPATLPAPTARMVGTHRVEVNARAPANGASARTRPGPRREQRWTISDPTATDLAWTLPDLSQVAGFDPSWSLSAGQTVDVSAVSTSAEEKLGDGFAIRSSTRTISIVP